MGKEEKAKEFEKELQEWTKQYPNYHGAFPNMDAFEESIKSQSKNKGQLKEER